MRLVKKSPRYWVIPLKCITCYQVYRPSSKKNRKKPDEYFIMLITLTFIIDTIYYFFVIFMNVPHQTAYTLRSEQLITRLFIRQRGCLSDIKVSEDLVVRKTTSLSDDGLITSSARYRMGDLVLAVFKVLVNGCYIIG